MDNITVLTACNSAYYDILMATNIFEYTQKWGYTFRVFNDENYFKVRPFAGWVKVLALRKVLRETDGWILWIDVDSLFTNMDIPVEQFINNDFDMIIGRFHNSPDSETVYKTLYHTGAFLIRNSPWTEDLIPRWYNCDQKFHEGYRYAVDEGALLEATAVDKTRMLILPANTICTTIRDETENDYIIHLAAWYKGVQERVDKIKELREKYNV